MSRKVGVNLSKFNTETTDLHLVVSTARTFDVSRWGVSSKVTTTVQAISRSNVELPPGFIRALGLFLLFLSPHLRIQKPVLDELLLIQFGRAKVAFGQTRRTNVNLADFANCTETAGLKAVDNQHLYIDHSPAGWDDILHRVQEARLARVTGDFVVTDSPLGLGGSVHVHNVHVWR